MFAPSALGEPMMLQEPPTSPHPRKARRRHVASLLTAAVLAAAAAFAAAAMSAGVKERLPPLPAPPAFMAGAPSIAATATTDGPSTFVKGDTPARMLLNRRLRKDDGGCEEVVMHSGSRRNKRAESPKKMHYKRLQARNKWNLLWVPHWMHKLTYKKEPHLEEWSQTLKVAFPEGEEDLATEEEIREYFTTDEYKPEAIVVGHKTTNEKHAKAYVHFATNAEAIKARKEKNGGSIGKVSEVKIVYTEEKKWIRVRDGVSLQGSVSKRATHVKAYGDEFYYDDQDPFGPSWQLPTLERSHPVYPE